MSSAIPSIRTRLLIISDTHGEVPFDPATRPAEASRYAFRRPLPKADVAIHCGDLTIRSDVKEYQATFDMMREVDASLKLVIPGNHDCSMDVKFWEESCARRSFLPPEIMENLLRRPQETYAVVEKARQDGIYVLVDEGTYRFVLPNGARLTIYASPWTPQYGQWGFQFDADSGGVIGGHDYQIEEGTDIAITHGPPYGILDKTIMGGENAGSRALLESVKRARPRVHCFGHIHEGYGALGVSWEGEIVRVVEQEGGLVDEAEVKPLNLCSRDSGAPGLVPGKDTLFVNAAIMDVHYKPYQSPWLVDLELPPNINTR